MPLWLTVRHTSHRKKKLTILLPISFWYVQVEEADHDDLIMITT